MTKKDYRDIFGGVALIVIGVFAAVHAQRYDLGELQRMGPGYFPVALGTILAILGVFVLLPAFFREGTSVKIQWKSLVWVFIGILAFAYTLNPLGLVFATAISVVLFTIASDLTWKVRFILGGCVALITYLIFSFGLGMVLPVWPWSY